MKTLTAVLLVLALAASLAVGEAALSVSGSTAANATSDFKGYLKIDADQDLTVAYGPLSLALNVGDTIDVEAATNNLSFGYVLSASHPVGAFKFYGSLESADLTVPLKPAGDLTGDWLKWIKAGVDFAAAPVAVGAYSLFSAKEGYPLFMAVEFAATVSPAWGFLSVGANFAEVQAATDDVGYKVAPRIIEGLSFFAKAKVSY